MQPQDFPLCWPHGQPRTQLKDRTKSKYRRDFKSAYNALFDAAKRFHEGPHELVISTSVPLSDKGHPIVGVAGKVADPGVAVYVWRDGRPYAICHDGFREIRENLNAIAKVLEGYWLIAKHASAQMRAQSMIGFQREIESPEVIQVPQIAARAA